MRIDARKFRRLLLNWFRENQRDLPWRRTTDPYQILVSEIMLQQTRVGAVLPFYARFLTLFPTPSSLALAAEDAVLHAWSGLGYYSRARNLRAAAGECLKLGRFPTTYEEIRALPGIGDYTAAAVASIAFGLPHAAVDGNVLRVLSRLLNDPSEINGQKARAMFRETAQQLLDLAEPGNFNQAMMELGATVCLPKNPACSACPVFSFCEAFAAGTQASLPVKRKPGKKIQEEITLFWIERGGKVLLQRRTDNESKMPGFWELPREGQVNIESVGDPLGSFRHSITIYDQRYTLRTAKLAQKASRPFVWILTEKLAKLPLTTATNKALRVLRV